MEIKFFRTINKGNLIASFTAVGKAVELREMKLMQGKDGLFIASPSRPYQDKDGTTKYADYYRITDDKLRETILRAAEAELQKAGVRMVQETVAQPDDDIPF